MYTKPARNPQDKTTIVTHNLSSERKRALGTDAAAREATDRGHVSAGAPKGSSCNTTPENTNLTQIPEENRILVDWLEFTLSDDFLIHDRYHCLENYIKMPGHSFQLAPCGMFGYKTQLLYGKSRILLDGNDGMGVHVILGGEALQEMKPDPLDVVRWVLHVGGKVTRLDLALDDVTGSLTVSRFRSALSRGLVSCRAKFSRDLVKRKISTGQVEGETIYLGSEKSKTQYRIYDKAAQLELEGQWTRLEGQYRKENAHCVAVHLCDSGDGIGSVFASLVRGYVNVHKRSQTDTNRSRWQVAGWWSELLQYAEKLKLSVPKKVQTLQKKREWFRKQVAPTYAMMLDVFGGDEMLSLYREGKARLSKEQRQMCAIPF